MPTYEESCSISFSSSDIDALIREAYDIPEEAEIYVYDEGVIYSTYAEQEID